MKQPPPQAAPARSDARADDVRTKAFEEWFADSKVVDPATGKPLVMYHGTAADFETFDNRKTGANDLGLWGKGHYLASSAQSANSYALRQGDGARVIPAYVSIQNPLVLHTGEDLVTRLPDGTNTRDLIGPNLDGAKIKAIAIAGGHDGVVQIKPNGSIGDVVAFRPEQIKSAIGNRGTFNPKDPNILHRSAQAHGVEHGHGRPLSADAMQALQRGDLGAALATVVDSDAPPVHRVLAERLRRLLQGATQVTLCPQLRDARDVAGRKSFGAATSDGSRIWLSLEDGVIAEETLLHEATHAAAQHVLRRSDAQLDAIQRAARQELRRLWDAARRAPAVRQCMSPSAQQELGEFVAEALTNAPLRQAMAAVRWTPQAPESLWQGFKRVLLGAVGLSERHSMMAATLQVVDTLLERPSCGAVRSPLTNPMFRNWFAGSAMVDRGTGEPLVLYHGTHRNFHAFDPLKQGSESDAGWYSAGFYFTPDAAHASEYAHRSTGAQVMPVYLSIQRPFDWRSENERKLPDSPAEALRVQADLRARGFDGVAVYEDTVRLPADQALSDAQWEMLVQAGSLGMQAMGRERAQHMLQRKDWEFKTLALAYGWAFARTLPVVSRKLLEVVVFRPEQIKSVIGNRGTFDPGDESILHQRAWHGTPHRGIERFSTEKIGTGEGAQAYGWGLYFASKVEVAQWYRDKLVADTFDISDFDLAAARKAATAAASDVASLERWIEDNPDDTLRVQLRLNHARASYTAARNVVAVGEAQRANPGQIYEVELPSDDDLLLWDKPLNEQPEKVREALKQIAIPRKAIAALAINRPSLVAGGRSDGFGGRIDADLASGQALYQLLAEGGYGHIRGIRGGQAASQALRAAGIRGIKYLDGSSRSAGEGSHNYVIFDGDDVQVVRRHIQHMDKEADCPEGDAQDEEAVTARLRQRG